MAYPISTDFGKKYCLKEKNFLIAMQYFSIGFSILLILIIIFSCFKKDENSNDSKKRVKVKPKRVKKKRRGEFKGKKDKNGYFIDYIETEHEELNMEINSNNSLRNLHILSRLGVKGSPNNIQQVQSSTDQNNHRIKLTWKMKKKKSVFTKMKPN